MMKFTVNPSLDMETLLWVSSDGVFEYDGPVLQMKKGRETAEQNMKLAQEQSKINNARSGEQYNTANKLEQESIGDTTPGHLSPAANAQLASDLGNVNRVYSGMRATAFSTLGQRGFGNAPSGFSTAANNGLDVGQEGAETGAFRNAQINTQNQRNLAMGTASSLSGQQGTLGNHNLDSSEQAAVDRSKMGSTLGDIGQGISTAAGIAGSVMGMPAWGKLGNKSGVKSPVSGVGSYGGGYYS